MEYYEALNKSLNSTPLTELTQLKHENPELRNAKDAIRTEIYKAMRNEIEKEIRAQYEDKTREELKNLIWAEFATEQCGIVFEEIQARYEEIENRITKEVEDKIREEKNAEIRKKWAEKENPKNEAVCM